MTQKAHPSSVLIERHGHVMLITINRPQALNAVDRAVWCAIGDALEDAEHDPNVRAVIITGAGTQSFCAGADLKVLARGERIVPDDPGKAAWGFAGIVEHPISKPVIAAVNGTALGSGTEIVLAVDMVVAVDTATFGLPEVKRGFVAGAGGAFRLAQQVPHKLAMEILLTGEAISAQRAIELGLVNKVVSQAKLMDTAFALAEQIAANAPLAVQASKRIALGMVSGVIAGDEAAWEICHTESDQVLQSEDAKEGPLAFVEKRRPNWKAR